MIDLSHNIELIPTLYLDCTKQIKQSHITNVQINRRMELTIAKSAAYPLSIII